MMMKKANYSEAQPFNLYVASLKARIHAQHLIYGIFLVIAVGFSVYLSIVVSKLQAQLDNPSAYLIPGHIPDVIKVRANAVPDSVVFDFFDYIAAQVGNLSSESIDTQYGAVERYLSPEFKARFRAANKSVVSLWKERRIDQFISYKPPQTFDRKNQDGRTQFTLGTWITVQRYMDGKALKPYKERLEISFQTIPIDETKAWIFEVTNIKRETAEESESRKLN